MTSKELLDEVTGTKDILGAYNIRLNSCAVARQSSENITLKDKEGGGLEIIIKPHTKGETVYIPACVTKSKISDIAYNDFYIGEDAQITIVAGCGIHTDDGHETSHQGIHRFFLGKGSRVLYLEKHLGTGKAVNSRRIINPVTEVFLEEDSILEMKTSQLGGIDYSDRKTIGHLKDQAKLIVKEHLLTNKNQEAKSFFDVELIGENSHATLTSRSVAKDQSKQEYHSIIRGLNKCFGHSECDAILADEGSVIAIPELTAANQGATLIHEAAIGKIAGEQLLKLQTLGFTEEEAEAKIIEGFLED